MKNITTVICSLLFVLAGTFVIGFSENNDSPTMFPGNATVQAAPQLMLPTFKTTGLPLDIQLDLEKRARIDTVCIHDTVYKTKYKTKKLYQVAVPDTVKLHDTLSVPVFYIATPLEHKIESTEIRVVDNVQINDLSETNQIDSIAHNN